MVPDFAYLRHRHIVNAGHVVRFEMDAAAQRLSPQDRGYDLILRSSPLARMGAHIDRTRVAEDVGGHGRTRQSTEPHAECEQRLLELLRQFKPGAPISSDMNLEIDLGFDSLERVQLIVALEKSFGFEIPASDVADFLVVADIQRYVESRASRRFDTGTVGRPTWHEILNTRLTAEEARQADLVLRPALLVRSIAFPFFGLVLLLMRLLFRVRVAGQRELPSDAGFALCVNHTSHLDPLFLACTLPLRMNRKLLFLGYSEYFASGRYLWLWRLLRVLPVDPDRYARSGMRLAAEGLRRNLITCVFPEGSRSANGRLQPFQGGLSVIGQELAVPIVPVAIVGSYAVWPRGSNRIRLQPVQVRFGKTIIPSRLSDLNATLYAAVNALLPNEQRGA